MNKLYLFILLLICILFLLPITEGFSFSFKPTSPLIGEFEYLAPIPPDNTWTQDTIDKFVDKYNSVNEMPEYKMLKSETFANKPIEFALEKEATYFIDNGKWPINKYVTDYLTNQKPQPPIFGQAIPNRPGKVYSLETLSTMFPSRFIYELLIAPAEMQVSPIPMSYQIYKGSIPPPASSTMPSF
jgi:hypothetical protein